MSMTTTWLTETPEWDKISLTLLLKDIPPRKQSTLENVLEKSDNFPIKFPVEAVRCKYLMRHVTPETLTRNINSAYPIIHEQVLHLYVKFLLYKRSAGSPIEQELYKNMSVIDFVNRLLTKRAVFFAGCLDHYELITRECGLGNSWERVGTSEETAPLLLKNCLSYHEMKLSAFLSVSSYSYFINSGSWYANGIYAEDRSEIQEEGVIVGLIGTRMHRPKVMEHEDIITLKPGSLVDIDIEPVPLKDFMMKFYREKTIKFQDIEKRVKDNDERFNEFTDGFFDNIIYAKRLAVSFDTFLIEANHRAKQRGKKGYVYVVGIGLGVWRVSDHQENLFGKVFAERLRVLGPLIDCISDVNFGYFMRLTSVSGYKDGEFFPINGHPNKGVTIHITRRLPFTKIPDEGKLLISSFAWDSNAAPGNEFWKGHKGNSSDSATASSTQVAEIHNAHINEVVCGENLMVVTQRGVLTIQEYVESIKMKYKKK